MLIESSYSVDFALQFGKAWNRIFGGCEFCNIFVLIRDSGLYLCVKKSLQRINLSFRSNQLYKSFRLIAGYFSSRNEIKFRHSFVSAQVFGLPSSIGPLGFPNKVCDNRVTYKSGGKTMQVDYMMCRRRDLQKMCDYKVFKKFFIKVQNFKIAFNSKCFI